MIEIENKSQCCGCEACANICPKKCIKMEEDNEGFRYPNVNKDICIDCKLCEKVCPLKKEPQKQILEKTEFYAAYNKNDEEIKNSSSGGMFYLLAKEILKKQGSVYGVIQNSTYDVQFIRATSKEECHKLRGSKYLQANVNGIYEQVKKDLDNDNYVLFSGTPCQIAALYKFIDKEYEKLLTVDVVCHGVPSSKVYRKYIESIESKYNSKVINIKWRDKVKGWGPNRVTIFLENGESITTPSRENPFQTGFLNNIYLRNSCYTCKYAKLPRIGDISLADFWGYEGVLKQKNNNKGLSIVIVSSLKGKDIFEKIKPYIEWHIVEEEYVKNKSRHVWIYPLENNKRKNFFDDLDKIPFDRISKKYGMKKSKIKKFLIMIRNKIRGKIKK